MHFCRGMGRRHALLVEELSHLRGSQMYTPKNYKEAARDEFKLYWAEAMKKEVANLTNEKVFTWVPRPLDRPLIDGTWAYKVKTNDKGQISKFKARCAARGFRQIYGVDFVDTFSSVGKLATFRTMLAEAAERGMKYSFCDIRSAYLQADLEIKQFMYPPPGFDPPKPGQVLRLDKALYGLKQSGREWGQLFRKNLLSWGFKASTADECLFVKTLEGSIIRVLLFVDDLAIFHDNDQHGRKMKKDLLDSIRDEGYDYSTSDDDHVYLGMAVHRINATCLFLTQERYVGDLSLKYGFNDCHDTWAPSPGGVITKQDCPHKPVPDGPCPDTADGQWELEYLDPANNADGK